MNVLPDKQSTEGGRNLIEFHFDRNLSWPDLLGLWIVNLKDARKRGVTPSGIVHDEPKRLLPLPASIATHKPAAMRSGVTVNCWSSLGTRGPR